MFEWPRIGQLLRCCSMWISEGSFRESTFTVLGVLIENVRLHGKIEFFHKRMIVGLCNDSQTFQHGRIQDVLFVASSQGQSPLP